MDKKQTVKNIVEQKLNFNQAGWYRISNQAKDLVNRMLDKNPDSRPSIEAVLLHEWLAQAQTLVANAASGVGAGAAGGGAAAVK